MNSTFGELQARISEAKSRLRRGDETAQRDLQDAEAQLYRLHMERASLGLEARNLRGAWGELWSLPQAFAPGLALLDGALATHVGADGQALRCASLDALKSFLGRIEAGRKRLAEIQGELKHMGEPNE